MLNNPESYGTPQYPLESQFNIIIMIYIVIFGIPSPFYFVENLIGIRKVVTRKIKNSILAGI
jgi:hypothetical protein